MVGPQYLWLQPTADGKYSLKCYIVADVCYAIRPTRVASVLNMYRPSLHVIIP